ncbi:g2142 [Coccomyxa viridis]|uniref:G2142 protein n=1 Tax=Coccomyxa viridis TaxID=1274662 RepID=A0ABP1FNE1_9CHLO
MQNGGRHSRSGWTPARTLLAGLAALVLTFFALGALFQGHIAGLEGASLRTPIQLGGPVSGTQQVPDDVASILQPTSTRYKGPLDLDAAVNERVNAINASWMASEDRAWWLEPGYHLSYMEDYPPYPFQRIKRVTGKDTGVMAIIAPFYDLDYYKGEAARAFFWRMKANGHIFVIITSYQEFPGTIVNPFDDRHTTPGDKIIHAAVDGYLHCFRQPDAFLPPGVPRMLLSESDFHDPDRRDGGGSLQPWGLPKEYDIFYSCQGGEWNDFARNWTLAKDSFKRLVTKLGIKVIIMGRDLTKEEDNDLSPLISSGHIVTHGLNTPWKDFLRYIESSRVLFAPNVHDASPRVLAEAMSLDVPILVNKYIVGGWKYVNQDTGAFFDSVDNVVDAYKDILGRQQAGELHPRQWFKANSGKLRSVFKLQAFLELAVGKERLKAAQAVANARVTY